MTSIKSLFENFLSLSLLQIFSYVFPLFVYSYLVYVIGAEKFGLIFLIFSFIQYFIILCDYGFDLSATREIALNRHNKNSLSNIFSSVILLKIIFVLLSFIVLLVLILTIDRFEKDKILFFTSFGMVIASAIFPAWFFQGMEKMKYISLLKIISQILFFISVFLFIKKDYDFIYVPALNSLCCLLSATAALYFALKKFNIRFYIPKYTSLKKQFLYSSEFFLSKVSLSFCTNTNTFCLGLISGDIIAGLYVSAEKIYIALKSLWMPVHNVFYPYVAKTQDVALYKKVLKYGILLNTIICFLVYKYAENIVLLFFGSAMQESAEILRIFSFILFVTVPSIMIGYPLLGTRKEEETGYKIVNNSILIATLFHSFSLMILYIYSKLNIYSVSYLLLVTETLLLLYRLFYVLKLNILRHNNSEG